MGNPEIRCIIISSRHLSFVTFTVTAADSFNFCFAQLRDSLKLRAGIRSMWRKQSNTRKWYIERVEKAIEYVQTIEN